MGGRKRDLKGAIEQGLRNTEEGKESDLTLPVSEGKAPFLVGDPSNRSAQLR